MTLKKIKDIKNDYLNGMTYKDIFSKYNITLSDLKKIIYKYNLKRSKRELLKGNQNARKNKGGTGAPINNKNAVVTGEYEKIYENVLTEEESKFYKSYEIENNDIDNLLIEEYKNEHKILTIRELRMLKRIKKLEELSEEIINNKEVKTNKDNKNNEVITLADAETISRSIQRIEDALTRVQESKRKSRENMLKLGFSKKMLELKEKQIENDIW